MTCRSSIKCGKVSCAMVWMSSSDLHLKYFVFPLTVKSEDALVDIQPQKGNRPVTDRIVSERAGGLITIFPVPHMTQTQRHLLKLIP